MARLSRDNLRDYVRTKLGRGTVRVELTDDQIDAAVNDATNLFNTYMPLRGMRMLPINTSGRHIISDLVPNLQDVIDVRGTRDRAGSSVGTNEKQRVTKSSGVSGTFVLAYNAANSTTIPVGATAGVVQAALENIPSLLRNILVGGPVGGPWIVEFTNQLGSRDVPQLTVTTQPTGGTVSVATLNNGAGSSDTGSSYDRIDLFDPLVHMSSGMAGITGLAAYWQSLEMLEQARRLFGAEVEWQGGWEYDEDRQEQVYALYVQVGVNTRLKYGIEYLTALTPDDNVRTGLSFVPAGMYHWFKSYVLAQSKSTLGRALRKFQGIPSPEGADLQLDGTELTAEAEVEITKLEEEIKNMRTSMPPLVG